MRKCHNPNVEKRADILERVLAGDLKVTKAARISSGSQDGKFTAFETDFSPTGWMAWPKLMAYARKGDTLAVVRLDRLGRSLSELLTTVERLRAQDIALLSLEENIDTSSAAGELIFHVFGSIAHFERRLISERTKDGIAAARTKSPPRNLLSNTSML